MWRKQWTYSGVDLGLLPAGLSPNLDKLEWGPCQVTGTSDPLVCIRISIVMFYLLGAVDIFNDWPYF